MLGKNMFLSLHPSCYENYYESSQQRVKGALPAVSP